MKMLKKKGGRKVQVNVRRYVVVVTATAKTRMSLKHRAQGQGEISGNIIILCRTVNR